MAGNDVYLYSVPSDADSDDVRLRDPTTVAGGSAINATLAVTIDNVTQAAEADLLIQATAAQTIEAVTLSTNADLLVQATFAQTIDPVTLAADADLLVQATAAQTLDNVTLSASGALPISATLSQTIDAITLSALAALPALATQGGGWLSEEQLREHEKTKQRKRKALDDLEQTIAKTYRAIHGLETPPATPQAETPQATVAQAKQLARALVARRHTDQAGLVEARLLKDLKRRTEIVIAELKRAQRQEEEAIVLLLVA